MRNTSRSIVLCLAAAGAACSPSPKSRVPGQTTFVSAPPAGSVGSRNAAGGATNVGAAAPPGAPDASGPKAASSPTRTVEETDLYRLDGDRLYYLNGYRGLMVFDVSDVDHPKLLGRSPIFGDPTEMLVRNGVAVVVVGDWYGALDDGTPFHGSIVRGLDATDPAHIKVLGEAKLGGWVRDTRVVGDVLYAVSEDYGWTYGWGDAGGFGLGAAAGGTVASPIGGIGGSTQESVIVSSVNFAQGMITAGGKETFPGYSGIFNVTPSAILLAHDPVVSASVAAGQTPPARTELLYLDISDPNGRINRRGSITVNGRAQGWGADNGRWNLDFADGKTAHVIGCADQYCGGSIGYVLATADFSNPDKPVLTSELSIQSTGWSAAARFDTGRLYLSPSDSVYPPSATTPFEVFDLTDPVAPRLAGVVQIPGSVWNILPAPGQKIFALGEDTGAGGNGPGYGEAVSLKYVDVSNPASPKLVATSTFGQGWAWTPAAGTFKAFTMDATKGMVVLPFSGWDSTSMGYNNGLQIIEFTPTSARTAGAARTRGWVERGIFVKNRLVSLSDLSLAVVDYTNHDAPAVVSELTLARNVVSARPQGATIAEASSDWWDNDVTSSEVRVLPLANAEEISDASSSPALAVDGVDARVFSNGDLAYVVTDVRVVDCGPGAGPGPIPGDSKGGAPGCFGRAEQVQVVDLSGGSARLRGKVQLPVDGWTYGFWGWFGFYWWDWYDGAEAVQVGGDALAFRRWQPVYGPNGWIVDSNSALFVVDLANPDQPKIASVTITDDGSAWWGDLRVVGNTLYTAHYEWVAPPGASAGSSGSSNAGSSEAAGAGTSGKSATDQPTIRYYVDRIDLSDRSHPRIGSKINVPGILVGGSTADPSLLYTIDYRWTQDSERNDFNVVRISGDVATLVSTTSVDGWMGTPFFSGGKAYFTVQRYDQSTGSNAGPALSLHALDLSNPAAPVDRVSSDQRGWGWLLDIQGDRAVVSSGWGQQGVDIYALRDGQPPQFRQFVRTRGWMANEISRQDSALFLSSGYWGVQRIDLE